MHPNSAFRSEDRALFETLIAQIGFGMVFAQTSNGSRVAHTPIWSKGGGAVQFHLARGNALSRHLDESDALIVVNGHDAYVSPRWYGAPDQVPTWNYVALEMEGPVRQTESEGLVALLQNLAARFEAHAGHADPWTMDEVSEEKRQKLLGGIVDFEMEVRAWRPTLKLSQNKSEEDRRAVADALESRGSAGLAQLMRTLAP